jgi:hypothetical protein
VSNNAKPLRIALALTDVPDSTSGNAFVSNLDLVVTASGNTYKGNVFSGGFSATGGAADTGNDVSRI